MSRPALALIHGWGLGRAVLQPLAEALTAHFDVRLVDLPGYGAAPDDSGGFAHTAQAIVEALPAGVILCGWSLGGMLALQAALLAPQRVARLILAGGTPSFTQRPDWAPAMPPELLDSFAASVAVDAAGTLKRFFNLVNQGDARARAISRLLGKPILSARLPEAATLLAGLGWLRDIDLRRHIASIATPTLLIHGENDPLMPLAAARWLHATLPHSRLEIFPGAAHAPFLNDPERFASLIREYCHAPAPDARNQAARP